MQLNGINQVLLTYDFSINSEYQERYKLRNISILVTISGMLVVNEFRKA